MHPFTIASLAAWALVVGVALRLRGRPYAAFVGVLLGLHTLGAVALYPHAGPLRPAFAYLQAAVYAHFLLLARPRLRPLAFRALVSGPAHYFVAATFLALPWALAVAFGLPPRGLFVPYVLALIGLVDSVASREEVVDLALDGARVAGLRRHARGAAREARPLRLVQITDPHLGPFMSEARLARICERAVARAPDLVLLTGDFLTMESQQSPDALARALAPLRALPGRVFACRGNHDHEAPDVVAKALAEVGARLLVDEAALVETGAGPVQVLGLDFHWRDRAARMASACAEHPRVDGALRLVLLHDPGAFGHLPEGEGDLVLSGHTHGGQLGLVRLGLPHTIVSALTKIPDHGFWARGPDRLYVHRGTGHYGFPLRLGVPSEQSLLRVHAARGLARRVGGPGGRGRRRSRQMIHGGARDIVPRMRAATSLTFGLLLGAIGALVACSSDDPENEPGAGGTGGVSAGAGGAQGGQGGRAGNPFDAGQGGAAGGGQGSAGQGNAGQSGAGQGGAGQGGAGGQGGLCAADANEPNDGFDQATKLSGGGDNIISDSDDPESRAGLLDGPDDVEWFSFQGKDDFTAGDNIGPHVILTANAAAEVCIFLRPAGGAGALACAPDGGAESGELSDEGFTGCCDSGEARLTFGGIGTDDNGEVLIKVSKLEGANCGAFSITYVYHE